MPLEDDFGALTPIPHDWFNEVAGLLNTHTAGPLMVQQDTIGAGETATVPAGAQTSLFGRLRVEGRLICEGRVRITD